MKIFLNCSIFIAFTMCIPSCRMSRTIAYYTPLNASQKEYINSIRNFWDTNPENIVKYEELRKYIDSYKKYPSMYNSAIKRLGIDSLSMKESESIFFSDEYALKPYTNSWILKTSDNFMWCKIWIANCDQDNNSCSICLQMVLIPNEGYKWQTSMNHRKCKQIMKHFEQDILKKIVDNINKQKKNNVP